MRDKGAAQRGRHVVRGVAWRDEGRRVAKGRSNKGRRMAKGGHMARGRRIAKAQAGGDVNKKKETVSK
jgi:hypothetical protein